MNKYQEALNRIFYELNRSPNDEQLFSEKEQFEDRRTVQKLVDRATPKQPLNRYTYNTDGGEKVENGECPHCHKAIVRTMDIESSFCDHCGQSLEWEDGDSK